MKLLFLGLASLLVSYTARGQEVTEVDYRRQAVFVEVLGNSLIGSINYDMRLSRGRQDGHGLRVGLGGFPVNGRDDAGNRIEGGVLVFPLSYNYLIGKRRSSLEVGAGITPMVGSLRGVDISGESVSDTGFTAAGFLNVGYRYQPLNKGLFFRFAWTPGVSSEGVFPVWLGLSLGYGFR